MIIFRYFIHCAYFSLLCWVTGSIWFVADIEKQILLLTLIDIWNYKFHFQAKPAINYMQCYHALILLVY